MNKLGVFPKLQIVNSSKAFEHFSGTEMFKNVERKGVRHFLLGTSICTSKQISTSIVESSNGLGRYTLGYKSELP